MFYDAIKNHGCPAHSSLEYVSRRMAGARIFAQSSAAAQVGFTLGKVKRAREMNIIKIVNIFF